MEDDYNQKVGDNISLPEGATGFKPVCRAVCGTHRTGGWLGIETSCSLLHATGFRGQVFTLNGTIRNGGKSSIEADGFHHAPLSRRASHLASSLSKMEDSRLLENHTVRCHLFSKERRYPDRLTIRGPRTRTRTGSYVTHFECAALPFRHARYF